MDMLESDIAAVCAVRGITSATILGQSMGGTLALKFAHGHRDLIKGLVLLAAPPRPPSQTFQLGKIGSAAWHAAIALNKARPSALRTGMLGVRRLMRPMREIIRVLGFNPYLANTADVEQYVEELLNADPNLFWDLAADLEGLEIDKLTPDIKCPTLVIAGARDQVVPLDHSVWLAKRLPAAELEIVKHGSHCPHFDDPPLVNRRIERFLKTHAL
jgi:pimeloyl-ACP methyl ester carboxylesterase